MLVFIGVLWEVYMMIDSDANRYAVLLHCCTVDKIQSDYLSHLNNSCLFYVSSVQVFFVVYQLTLTVPYDTKRHMCCDSFLCPIY